MFKHAQLYRLTYPVNRDTLEAALASFTHAEIGNSEAMRQLKGKP